MKKGLKSLAVIMAIMTSASALASCSSDYTYPDADWNEGVIANVGGKEVSFKDVYDLMEGKKESAKAMYATASNILAQFVTPRSEYILTSVEQKMDDQKETWKSSASTNNTSYKEEQQKTFDSEGVLDEEGLRNKWIAAAQVSQNKSDYNLTYNGTTEGETSYQYHISEQETKNFVKTTRPYHVSHILVKVDASGDGAGTYEGTISSDNAKKIGNVVSGLISSESFGDTAYRLSDDSSNTSYGDLFGGSTSAQPLMTSTSYVNEFKLGLYSYEAFINSKTKDNKELREALRIPGTEIEGDEVINKSVTNDTINSSGKAFGIPISAALTLAFEAEQDKSFSGYAVKSENNYSVSANQYPRNILFNNYFNNHEISFLYNDRAEYPSKFVKDVNAIVAARNAAKPEGSADVPAYSEVDIASTIAALKDGKDSSATPLPEDFDLSDKYDEWVAVSRQLGLKSTDGSVNEESTAFDATKFQTIAGVSDKLVTYKSNTEAWNDDSVDNIVDLPASYGVLSYKREMGGVRSYSPVLVTRAGSGSGDSGYQGIHFIVVNNDPFGTGDDATDKAYNEGVYQYRYYRVNKPDTTHTDTTAYTADYSTNPSIVNFLKSDLKSSASSTFYSNRITAVNSTINGYDSNADFKLWESNLAKFKAKFNRDFTSLLGDYASDINLYITQTKAASKTSANETLDASWKTFVNTSKLYEDLQKNYIIPTSVIAYFQYGEITADMEATAHVKK